jgi:hypothetical protein
VGARRTPIRNAADHLFRLNFETSGWRAGFSCRIGNDTTIKWFTLESKSFDPADGLKNDRLVLRRGYVQVTCSNSKQSATGGASW